MSVGKRKDGRWIVKFKDESGKWQQRSFTDESTAVAFDVEQREAEQGDDRLSVVELVAAYLRSRPELHPETKEKITRYIVGYTDVSGAWHEGRGVFLRDKYAEELTRRDLEMLRESMRATGTGNNTINKMQAYIRAILAWGVDQQLIKLNPWRDYKRLSVQRKQITSTLGDFKIILAECPDWFKWAFATAYALAMRPGMVELFSLSWSAFNWRHGFVQYAQGKTGRIKRVVPPQEYWEKAKERFREDMAAGIPWVCHRNGKKVLSYNSDWRAALKKSGMQGRGIRPYDIRHVAASEMLAAGADLAAVAAQMGHASIQTTATTYAHVTPGGQARAAALLPALDTAPSLVRLVQLGAEKDTKKA